VSETVQEWLERTASNPRVVACGVRLADRSILARSGREELAETRVNQAMRQLSEGVFVLQQSRLAADQLRWTFEGGIVRCAIRPGGVLGFLVVGRDSVDLPEIEQLLADFALVTG
jgi:hypothetical protein